MLPKQVKYRGRWFPVISETETEYVIESWGTQRTVFKDEIIYEEPEEPKDVVSDDAVKDVEILTPKNDILPSTTPEGKDLVQEAPNLEPGTYVVELQYPDPREPRESLQYKVTFSLYGHGLSELNIIRVDDVESPQSNTKEYDHETLEKLIDEKLKSGEFIKLSDDNPEDQFDEKVIKTVQNPDATPIVKTNDNTTIDIDGQNKIEKFEEIQATKETNKFPLIGLDMSIFDTKERQEQNKETIENSIISEFKNSILNMFENPDVPSIDEPSTKEMTTELDSGKEYNVKYTIEEDEYIDVQEVQDTITNAIVEFKSLPHHEQQEVLGAIAAQEELELDLEDLQEEEPCWDGYEMIGMKKEGPNCVPIKEELPLNEADKKKWKTKVGTKKDGSPRYVKHGHKDYKIAPGTSRGDSYCARSAGIKKDGKKMNCAGKDKNTPNCLSRRKWKCRGKKSMK